MDFKTCLLTELLDCGYADINFLEKEMDNFEVDFDDLDISTIEININSLIEQIYLVALSKLDVDMYDEEWENRINIFTNSIDSHLWIDDEEMYSLEDLKNFLEKE